LTLLVDFVDFFNGPDKKNIHLIIDDNLMK